MGQFHSTSDHEVETVLMVGVQLGRAQTAAEIAEHLDELAELCKTAGAVVAERVTCRMPKPNPAAYIGEGKAMEIAATVAERRIATVVFDDELSPAQSRNLEKIIGTKIVDRTQVILDIFAQRARTSEGRMQIELAQLEYLLPRLRRMWTHLERQRGGIGMHGPGEKQLEVDRRRIEEKIGRYHQQLERVRTRRSEQRRGRHRHGWALISLVGYTNAGKSTLLNRLTGAEVLAYDKLFATLDPTTRKVALPNHQMALMTDTVGFIRKLPHGLVEAFKATLEEVIEADLLVHVVDASHPQVDEQIKAVMQVLAELGVHDKPVVTALNKIDAGVTKSTLRRLSDELPLAVGISAKQGDGLDRLCDTIADQLRNRNVRLTLRIPAAEGRVLAALHAQGTIFSEDYEGDVVRIEATIPSQLTGIFAPFTVVTEGTV